MAAFAAVLKSYLKTLPTVPNTMVPFAEYALSNAASKTPASVPTIGATAPPRKVRSDVLAKKVSTELTTANAMMPPKVRRAASVVGATKVNRLNL